MTVWEALDLLANVTGALQLNRSDHTKIQQAINILRSALAAKIEEVKED